MDILIRGLWRDLDVRFVFADTATLVGRGIEVHDCDPAGATLFGEALTVGALLSVLLDGSDRYSLRFDYRGEAGTLLVDVDAGARVRGLIANSQPAGCGGDRDRIFGREDALLTFVKSDGGKVLNSGRAACGLASVAGDAGMFFALSDQLETEFAVEFRFRPDPADPVAAAAGFMLQAMPGCDLEKFAVMRQQLHEPGFRELLVDRALPLETKLKKLLARLAAEPAGYELGHAPEFFCGCSADSMKRALLTLGKAELRKLFAEQPHPELVCRYCRKKHIFSASDFDLGGE